ncbi:MAG: hypothetical protein JOY62_11260 [Acidobacteriaceae bacterium]|nr:hypothetical protein [Acidobacteriaceae bacterium]MBV9780537.1 hypothetical protein [Acidobacteriaceae bacterium]
MFTDDRHKQREFAWISWRYSRPRMTALAAVVLVSATLAGSIAQAQTETVLYAFTGATSGSNPNSGLVRDEEGNLYGTVLNGGAGRISCSYFGLPGCGTVFKVDPRGNLTVLHNFTLGADGAGPWLGTLIRDEDGNLYGTTYLGGFNPFTNSGAVFKVDRNGKETVLYVFKGGTDGGGPFGGLTRDEEGNLYGTTSYSGAFGYGVVFKLDPSGKETVLHSFAGPDGSDPSASLIRDRQGNLYGTTFSGGANGLGTVFKLDPTGVETVLHSFTGNPDGADPIGGVIRGKNGNLYGTTSRGGAYGQGTVFKLDPAGNESVLYSFTGKADGGYPGASVIRDEKGNLYGTALFGGIQGSGVVFKLDPNGKETVLYSFTGGADGANPYAPLIRDREGNLYSTTSSGGDLSGTCAPSGCGVVFKLTPAGGKSN